jgi:hypothetical protein
LNHTVTIEQAADQALLIKLIREEIAAFKQQPTELVMGAAALSAELEGPTG